MYLLHIIYVYKYLSGESSNSINPLSPRHNRLFRFALQTAACTHVHFSSVVPIKPPIIAIKLEDNKRPKEKEEEEDACSTQS